MNLEHCDYVAPVLRVIDLTRSLAFYRDRLGFSVEFVHEDSYASVRRGHGRIHLKSASIPHDQTASEQDEHIDAFISTADADALSASFASKEVPFVVPLREMPYGTEFYVRDPDGYVLGFVQSAST